jgi:stalled ribosome rescue protein Dom34
MDHHEARIVDVDAQGFDEAVIGAPYHHVHRHPRGATEEHHHPDDLHRLFREVADALRDAEEILVVGPSTTKLQFLRYLHAHAPAVDRKIVGLESIDHPTDRQFVAYVKQYFHLSAPRGR